MISEQTSQRLFNTAKQMLEDFPEAVQAVVCETEKGNIRSFVAGKTCDTDAENAFADTLLADEDSRILFLVVLWRGCFPDIPSEHLRKLLLNADPVNRDALMLLQGSNSIV